MVAIPILSGMAGNIHKTTGGKKLEEIAKTYSGRANVIKVNVDDAPKTTESYGVRSIPTLVFIRDGKVRETISGLATHDKLAALIDQNMPG